MKIILTTKVKNDYLKDWLLGLGFNSEIVDNYDTIGVEMTSGDINLLKEAADDESKTLSKDAGEVIEPIIRASVEQKQ